MTTTNISIQDLVQREVIYCVSSLVYTLTQENKLDEELAIDLWTGTINYDDAELAIKGNNAFVRKQDKHYGVYDEDLEEFIVDADHKVFLTNRDPRCLKVQLNLSM